MELDIKLGKWTAGEDHDTAIVEKFILPREIDKSHYRGKNFCRGKEREIVDEHCTTTANTTSSMRQQFANHHTRQWQKTCCIENNVAKDAGSYHVFL